MGFPSYVYDISLGILCDSYWVPMIFGTDFKGISMRFLWDSKGCLWDFFVVPILLKDDFHGISMEFLWDFKGMIVYGISMEFL